MVEATAPEQAVCLAGLPLIHSTLVPGTMRAEQQGQTEANLAAIIIGGSVVVVVLRAFLPPTSNTIAIL
jgi:hypothetical protein